jgi:hypothetical protein
MSRLEQRAVIRYLTLKNPSVAEIATKLQSAYGTDTLKHSTVSKWWLCFQDGSDNLFDLARSGSPSHSDLVAPIQSFLQQFPFISCQTILSQAEDRHGNMITCASRPFASWKVQFTLCSAFTGSRAKAVADRTFPRASPDIRTRLTI